MPTYVVKSDDEVIIRMTGDDPDSPPSSIEAGDPLHEPLVSYARMMADDPVRPASIRAIASRMGSYNQLVVEDGVAKEEGGLTAGGDIAKIDPDQRLVFGWAYVTHDREGNVVVDKSGDFVDDYNEIEKSAYKFVLKSRQGDVDHTNVAASEMVESMVFTPEKIAKMGIPPGTVPTGWWVGFRINDDAAWDSVKSGERTAFSIHGSGTRKSVED